MNSNNPQEPVAPEAAEIMRISSEFAVACADCEHLRTTEPYPWPQWHAAWQRRLSLALRWQAAAKRLTDRETDSPENRNVR